MSFATSVSADSVAIGSAKQAEGAVSLSNVIVTSVLPDRVYIEESNRSSAIRIQTTTPLSLGDKISPSGFITTVDGEQVFVCNSVGTVTGGQSVPKPLAVPVRSIVGKAGAHWLDTEGLYVRICGTVTYSDPNGMFLYVDDGSAVNDGNTLLTGWKPAPGIRVIAPTQSVIPPTNSRVIVTGISSYAAVGSGFVRAIRIGTSDDLQALQWGMGPQPQPLGLRFAIINPLCDSAMYSLVRAQLNRLGIEAIDAWCDSNGNIQATAGTYTSFENTLDGAICIDYCVSDSSGVERALAKTHAFKMLFLSYVYASRTSVCNTGMSELMSDTTSLSSGVPQQAFTQIGGSEARSIAAYFGIWSKSDGVTPITKLLYLKFGSTERYVAWETPATGNMFAQAKESGIGAADLVNVIIGLYVNRLNKVAYTHSLPMYINTDDANVATSAHCISSVATALRASGGMIPTGWGTDWSDNPISPAPASPFTVHPGYPETATAWGSALDVMPQILHDHETLPGQSKPLLQQTWSPDSISTALDSRLTEAQSLAGFNLRFAVGDYTFAAWNKASDNGLVALARRGVRTVRNVLTETGATRPTALSLYDASLLCYDAMRIVPTSSGGNGEWREAFGTRLMSAIRYTGHIVCDHTLGKVFYFHGPQFATNNLGGIRSHKEVAMAAGDTITVRGVTYTWVASGAAGNQFNVTGSVAVDMSNLANKLGTDLSGIATVVLTNDSGQYPDPDDSNNVEIAPIDPSVTISVECNEPASLKIEPIPCTPRDVASEIIETNYANLSTLAPMYRIANYDDWQALQ